MNGKLKYSRTKNHKISIFELLYLTLFNGFSQALKMKFVRQDLFTWEKIAHFLKNFAVTKAFWRVKFKRQFSFLVYSKGFATWHLLVLIDRT